jgi:hypothetical protein
MSIYTIDSSTYLRPSLEGLLVVIRALRRIVVLARVFGAVLENPTARRSPLTSQ